jgi:S1-C subfamily serine protease
MKLAAFALIPFLLSPAAHAAETRCPEGHPETGDLGIEYLLCVSGSCAVNLQTERGYVHDFSTEPRIGGIVDGSPADGKLQDGDILIAIDGVLITTREGGRRLANLQPGTPVSLRLRRGGREMDVTVVPRLGCNMPRLAVLADPAPRATPAVAPQAIREAQTARPAIAPRAEAVSAVTPRPAIAPRAEATSAVTPRPAIAPRAMLPATPATPPFTFGLELECGACGWRADAFGALRWSSAVSPTVQSVEPGGPGDQAGLKPGDVLLEIDSHALNSEESGRALGKLRAGQTVTLKFRRGDEVRTVSLTPRGNPPTQRF